LEADRELLLLLLLPVVCLGQNRIDKEPRPDWTCGADG